MHISADTFVVVEINLLVLQYNHGVGVADCSLQETLCVLCAVWRNNLQPRYASIPRSVVLGMLGSDTGGETVGTAESDVAGLDSSRHVVSFRGRVDNLINSLHSEIEGHELALESFCQSHRLLPASFKYVQRGVVQRGQRQQSNRRIQIR